MGVASLDRSRRATRAMVEACTVQYLHVGLHGGCCHKRPGTGFASGLYLTEPDPDMGCPERWPVWMCRIDNVRGSSSFIVKAAEPVC